MSHRFFFLLLLLTYALPGMNVGHVSHDVRSLIIQYSAALLNSISWERIEISRWNKKSMDRFLFILWSNLYTRDFAIFRDEYRSENWHWISMGLRKVLEKLLQDVSNYKIKYPWCFTTCDSFNFNFSFSFFQFQIYSWTYKQEERMVNAMLSSHYKRACIRKSGSTIS